MPRVGVGDYSHAKIILISGANAQASHIHLLSFLRQAKRNGATIAVVDPIANFTANEADLHLPVFPGGDLPVALAMIRLWKERGLLNQEFLAKHADGLDELLAQANAWPLERAAAAARVPADDIRSLAEMYSASSPAVIRVGWGLERNRNGGQAMAAVMAVASLLNKVVVGRGGS